MKLTVYYFATFKGGVHAEFMYQGKYILEQSYNTLKEMMDVAKAMAITGGFTDSDIHYIQES